ncbi:MAG: hypothetical protein LCH30_06755 [Proteobacteria bacterium]|nr:hypothetical protein [Pseudomonadota bacterium]
MEVNLQDQIDMLVSLGLASDNFQRRPKNFGEMVIFSLFCLSMFPRVAAQKEHEKPLQLDNHKKDTGGTLIVSSSTAAIRGSTPPIPSQQRQQELLVSRRTKAPIPTKGEKLKMAVKKKFDEIPGKMDSTFPLVTESSSKALVEKSRQSIENPKVYAHSLSLLKQPDLPVNIQEEHCALVLIGYEVYGNHWDPTIRFCTSTLKKTYELAQENMNVDVNLADHDVFSPTFNLLVPYYEARDDYNPTQFLGQIIAYFRTHFAPKGSDEVIASYEIVNHYIRMVQAWFRLEKSATFSDAKPVLYLWSTLLHIEYSLSKGEQLKVLRFYMPSLVDLQQKFSVYAIPPSLDISPNANKPHFALFKEAFSWAPVLEILNVDTALCQEICTVISRGAYLFNYFEQIEKSNLEPYFSPNDRFPYRTSKMVVKSCAEVFGNYYQETRVGTQKSDKDSHLALFLHLANLMYGDISLTQKEFDGSLLKYPFIALEEWLDFELTAPAKNVKLQIQVVNYIEKFLIFYDKNFSRYPVANRKDIAIKFAKLKLLYGLSESSSMTTTALLITSVSILTTLGFLWKRKQNQEAEFKSAIEKVLEQPKRSKMTRVEKSPEPAGHPVLRPRMKSLLDVIMNNINKINDSINLIKDNRAFERKINYLSKQKELLLSLQNRLNKIEDDNLTEIILGEGREEFNQQKVEDAYFKAIEKERLRANNHKQALAEKTTSSATPGLSSPQQGISEETLERNTLIWHQRQQAAQQRALSRLGLFSPPVQNEMGVTMQTSPVASSSNDSDAPISLQNTRAIIKERTIAFQPEDERYLKAATDSLERLYSLRTIVLTQEKLENKERYGILYNLMRFHHVIGILHRRHNFSWPFEEREALSIRNTIRHGHFLNYDEGLSSYILALHNSFYNDLLKTKTKLSISMGTVPLPTKAKPYGQDKATLEQIQNYEENRKKLGEDISKYLKIIGELFIESEQAGIPFEENDLLHCSLKMLISIIGKNLILLAKMHASYDVFISEWALFNSSEKKDLGRAKKYSNYVGHHFDEIGEGKHQQGYSEANEAGGDFLYEYEEITVDELRTFSLLIARKVNKYEPAEATSSSAPSASPK